MPPNSQGEQALLDAIHEAYPGIKVHKFATPQARVYQLAGVFAGIVEAPTPHWVVVSRGCTELDEKQEENPAVSGWGFELTCRVPATTRDPNKELAWVFSWMQGLVDRMAETGTVFEPSHYQQLMAPVDANDKCGVLFFDDTTLRGSRSANGSFDFLQLAAATQAELDAVQSWDSAGVLGLMRAQDPLLQSDPERPSYTNDPAFASAVASGREREGSSTGMQHGIHALWLETRGAFSIHLPVQSVPLLRFALNLRLRHGKPMLWVGAARKVSAPDGTPKIHGQTHVVLLPEEGACGPEIQGSIQWGVMRLPPSAVTDLLGLLQPSPGSYTTAGLDGAAFVVVPDERFAQVTYPW